jgi:pimeloyl-ACP methyl ester carboxylesterase
VKVPSGKAQIAVDVTDATDGPPVLMLHAGVTDRRSWRALTDTLGSHRRCIAVDRRGFGDTLYEPEPFSHVDDSLAVLDDLGVATAAVVGGSMGGRVALDLALTHPDRVAALVLVGAAVRGAPELVPDPPSVRALTEAIAAAEEAGDLSEVNRLEAHLWLDGPDAGEGRVGGELRDLFLDMNRIALEAVDPGPEADAPPVWDRLGDIDVPTLVLVGELDRPNVVARADAIGARMPHATVRHLPGTAHVPQLEGHRELLQLVAGFLATEHPV